LSINIISLIGLGYIGLPTAAMFASKGKKVIGVDVNQHLVDTINAGKTHIVEPGLDSMVKKAVDKGFLKATTTPEPADAFLIAVPTPFLPVKEQGSIPEPDLSFIKSAAKAVAKVLKKGDLVILESTSPVGTTQQMSVWLAEERADLSFPQTNGEGSDIRIAHCPERVLPGNVIRELVENDRIIGGMTKKCSEAAIELYRTFVEGDCVVTNARTAELAKLAENSSRDVNIAFANELSIISDKLDIDVWELISIVNRHPRVKVLRPGPGVGGHCIAVDPWFILASAPDEAKLVQMARQRNVAKEAWAVDKINRRIMDRPSAQDSGSEFDVVILGLAFKENIDDLRESPAVRIVKELLALEKYRIGVVEPYINILPSDLRGANLIDFCNKNVEGSLVVILVGHSEFSEIKEEIGALDYLDFVGLMR